MSDNIVQIPFSAFKLIDLGQSVGLSVYQSLYTDHSEPVGLISLIQALGLLQPSAQAVDNFNKKWTKESVRWRIQETGIEVVTGKSSATGEMAKTRDGEAALLVVSFLIEALGVKTTSDLVRSIIEATPSNLLPIKPRRTQVANVVTAIESQTTCVSWQDDILNAQECVFERPVVWASEMPLPEASFDLPVGAMKAFYQALCIISRFPDDYRCVVKTPLSLTLAFALAHSICGLRVCVVINGEQIHGNFAAGGWQVRLERYLPGMGISVKTEVKLGRKMEDAQDLFVINEVGPVRANRISINGIAKTATISQGLGVVESEEMVTLAIGAAVSILGRYQKELVDESGDNDTDDVSFSASQTSTKPSIGGGNEGSGLVPFKTRVTVDAIATWWGCSTKIAAEMLHASQAAFASQPESISWTQLRFSRSTTGKIAEFEDLDNDQKLARRYQTNHPLDRRDYARLAHMLTTQLLLITLLQFNTSNKDRVRVRSTCSPQNSELGRAIKSLDSIEPLRQSVVLYSWYFWLHGKGPKMPEGQYGLDVVSTEGYLIYRNLLLELNLSPASCEMVTVEPGHIRSENQRLVEIRGPDNGYAANEMPPQYRKELRGRAKLRPQDRTGPLQLSWVADEGDDSLDLEMQLKTKDYGLSFSASVYQITKLSWSLHYGDRSIGCTHDEERVGALVEGERVEVVSAGALELHHSSAWKPLLLLSANGNELSQIACLLSVSGNSRGMLRREACLRCCITACEKMGLDFLID
jgi:hypothetical protein